EAHGRAVLLPRRGGHLASASAGRSDRALRSELSTAVCAACFSPYPRGWRRPARGSTAPSTRDTARTAAPPLVCVARAPTTMAMPIARAPSTMPRFMVQAATVLPSLWWGGGGTAYVFGMFLLQSGSRSSPLCHADAWWTAHRPPRRERCRAPGERRHRVGGRPCVPSGSVGAGRSVPCSSRLGSSPRVRASQAAAGSSEGSAATATAALRYRSRRGHEPPATSTSTPTAAT